jgi:hypothetical protein
MNKSARYLTNIADKIDLDQLIESIPIDAGWHTPSTYDNWLDRIYTNVLPYDDNGIECLRAVNEWNDSGVDFNGIEVKNIQVNDLDPTIKETFKDLFAAEEIVTGEFSRIMPGKCIPYHCDVWQNEYDERGIKKVSIFCSPPDFGHVLVLGEDYYCSPPQGDVIEWLNPHVRHTGINFGITPKWLLQLVMLGAKI